MPRRLRQSKLWRTSGNSMRDAYFMQQPEVQTMSATLPDPETEPGLPRLVRLYIRQVAIGFALAVVATVFVSRRLR